VYIGSTHNEPLPNHFLDDMPAEHTPVVGTHHNIRLGTEHLSELVTGIRDLGLTFVSPAEFARF
jgi:hypothetical protein